MADVYGVVAADIAAELPALFPISGAAPSGFTTTTKPTLAKVTSWISTADSVARLHVLRATDAEPASTDAAAPIAKQFIAEWVKGHVIRAVYEGNAPERVEASAGPYEQNATDMLKELDGLKGQAAGTGDVPNRVQGAETERELLITDDDIGFGENVGASRSLRF